MSQPHLRVTLLAGMLVAVLAVSGVDAAARTRHPHAASAGTAADTQSIATDEDGTPVIMKGYHAPPIPPDLRPDAQRPKRPVPRRKPPIGSSTYIPPPVPSPNGGPPAPSALQMGPGPYKPPPLNSFGDRVTNCLHSFPLNAGVGNNPIGHDAYVRSCAN